MLQRLVFWRLALQRHFWNMRRGSFTLAGTVRSSEWFAFASFCLQGCILYAYAHFSHETLYSSASA